MKIELKFTSKKDGQWNIDNEPRRIEKGLDTKAFILNENIANTSGSIRVFGTTLKSIISNKDLNDLNTSKDNVDVNEHVDERIYLLTGIYIFEYEIISSIWTSGYCIPAGKNCTYTINKIYDASNSNTLKIAKTFLNEYDSLDGEQIQQIISESTEVV